MAKADIDALTTLREKADKMRREADRAQGALDQVMKQLREEFSCKTLDEAEKKLQELSKGEAKAKKAFDDALASFEEEWRDALEQ